MDILSELRNIPTTCISDVMGGLHNMDSAIKALRDDFKICGPALTAKLGVNDNSAALRAIRAAQPGQVLVADSKASLYNPVAGDFVVGMAKIMGIAGIVADGVVRDQEGIKALGLPVFCRGTTIAKPEKGKLGEVNVTISCGGVPVSPGDWIVGDADGVTVIPAGLVEKIIPLARKKVEEDEERSRRVLVSKEEVRRQLELMAGK